MRQHKIKIFCVAGIFCLAAAVFAAPPPPPSKHGGDKHHHKHKRDKDAERLHLAASIVGLVGDVITAVAPQPQQVIVTPAPVVVTPPPPPRHAPPPPRPAPPPARIPEYGYGWYNGLWVPQYGSWYWYNSSWAWGGHGRPPAPPAWRPDPRRPAPPRPQGRASTMRGPGYTVPVAPGPGQERFHPAPPSQRRHNPQPRRNSPPPRHNNYRQNHHRR